MLVEVVVDVRMVVALSTLQIHSEEQSADISNESVFLDGSIEVELRGGTLFLIDSVRTEDLRYKHVERFVILKRRREPAAPLGSRHVLVRPTFHQQDVKHRRHVLRESFTGEQPVNQFLTLLRIGILNKSPCGSGIRNRPGQIQRQPAKKLRVGSGLGCGNLIFRKTRIDQFINRLVEGRVGCDMRHGEKQEHRGCGETEYR
jgi:hypothetical protein